LNGIDVNLHEIIIFVDSDNQNTTEMLLQQKSLFPNLVIVKNNGPPIGYASNINWMFKKAKYNITSYIQSDQVICLDYDTRILSHLTNNMILSSTRIEPPLHSQFDNAITYVKDFGLVPSEFRYEEFLRYTESIKNKTKLTNYFFAPFTLYKHLWTDIGGHDVSFKKSREDSDIAVRFCLKKYDLIQCWDALVYHFSCTSSRGLDWWKSENKDKEIVRQQNDAIEMKRFIDKWGIFIHPSSYKDIEALSLDNSKILVKNPSIDKTKFEIL
jgi:GT2 family glycosyltransferase